MNEREARRLFLVRAVELEDTAEALLTREDRQQATDIAVSELSRERTGGSRRTDKAFLAARSAFAFSRLESRFPTVGKAWRQLEWPALIDWAVPVGALAIGVATNEIDNGSRLSIIAFPLIGMLAWNLAVYALLATRAVRSIKSRPASPGPNFLVHLLTQGAARKTGSPKDEAPLRRALARFSGEWLDVSSTLTARRAARTLHMAAAALAAGVLVGMYLRALSVEYVAGWESTFIGAGTLQNLLGVVLGPASLLTGIALPDAQHLQAIRWTGGAGGENAGPWIHLYATTAGIFIIAPRLLLAAGNAVEAFRLKHHFPTLGPEDFYIRRLLRGARGEGASVRVIPYSFHASQPTQRQLQRVLEEVLGDGARVTVDTPIPYGGEDEWLDRTELGHDLDHVVLIFNLAATPEAENHGALVAGVRRHLTQTRNGAGLTVLLEESAFRLRLAGQAGAEERLETRRMAWNSLLGRQGVSPLSIDLDDRDLGSLARRLEGALIKEPGLAPKGAA